MQTAIQRWGITAAVALATTAVDFSTKVWARSCLQEGMRQSFIPGFLQFVLTTNTGGAFGIGKNSKEFMTLLAISVCAAIVYWIYHRERRRDPPAPLESIGLGLILGGAAGNLVDRFTAGRVTDFIEFAFVQFPVFNFADAIIDVGIGLLFIQAFRAPPQTPERQAQEEAITQDPKDA
jgi:signal peptidase II